MLRELCSGMRQSEAGAAVDGDDDEVREATKNKQKQPQRRWRDEGWKARGDEGRRSVRSAAAVKAKNSRIVVNSYKPGEWGNKGSRPL